ncbi:MAG: hypothetical protein JKY87_00270 [Mariprofundus sp.]|nr:hypothetical protein [Mariprofundus sp.]
MINIFNAETKILSLLTNVTMLAGEINSLGSYVVFDKLKINNAFIDDVDYIFNLFIAISSKTKNKRLAYAPLDEALTALMDDYQVNQDIELGGIVPYSIKGLIVYKIPLTVRGFKGEDYV